MNSPLRHRISTSIWVALVLGTLAARGVTAQTVTVISASDRNSHAPAINVPDPDGTWTANASGNWSDTSNWAGGTVADGGGFANFSTLNITALRTVTIDTTSRTVRRIDIGDTDDSHSYNISASGGASLIFDNTANSANAQLNQTATSNGDTISAPIILNSSLDVTNASVNTLTFSTGEITAGTAGTKTITTSTGNVTDNASTDVGDGNGVIAWVHNGPGTLTLRGQNTYSGGTTVNGGILQLGSNGLVNNTGAYVHGPVGIGTLTLNSGATLEAAGTSNRTIQNNLSLNGSITLGDATNNGILTFNSQGGTNTLSTLATATLTGNTTLTVQSEVRIADAISGPFSLTKAGPAVLRLDVANTYSGGTFVSGGTLIGNADGSLGSGNVSLTAASVTLTLQNGAVNNYIANSANVSIVTGATANLNFTGAPDIVGGLVLGGVAQTNPGTYGGTGSGADFQSAFFTGSGTVELVPEPSTWALLVLGAIFIFFWRRWRRRTRASAAALLALATIPSLHANIIDWGNTGNDFNANGSWVGGAAPGSNDIAQFDSAKVNDPNLTASLTIQDLNFSGVSGYTLTSGPGFSLTLTNTGSNDTAQTSAVLGSNNSGTNTVNANLILGGGAGLTQSLSQKAGGTLVINGTLTNTNALAALRLAAAGTIDLTADNSLTLNVPIHLLDDTTLQIGNNNALGSGVLSVLASGTTIQSDSSTNRVLPNAIFISANVTTFGAGGDLTFSGGMTQDADQTIVVNNNAVTVSSLASNISAVRNITKEGPGALLVNGNRTQGGMTKVTGGTFGVAGSFTSQDVILNGGVLALSDSGLGGAFTRSLGTTTSTMRWTDSGGFAAYGTTPSWGAANNLTVNVGGAGATLTWGSTSNFLAGGQTLILGSPVSNGTVTFQNGLNFGATDQTIQTDRGATAPTGGVDAVISGTIASSGGGFTKTGAGALSLTGNNTYTGATNVNGGTLLVNGNQSAATGAVTVNSGATLGGSGTIGGSVTVNSGGTLAPGNSPGILRTGSLSLMSGSNFVLELNNTTAGSGYDQVVVTGGITLGGNLIVVPGSGLSIGDKFFIVLNDGSDAVSGTFAQGGTVTGGGDTFSINYADNGDGGGTANDISLTVTGVPEPGSSALLLLGCGAVLMSLRQKLSRRPKRS